MSLNQAVTLDETEVTIGDYEGLLTKFSSNTAITAEEIISASNVLQVLFEQCKMKKLSKHYKCIHKGMGYIFPKHSINAKNVVDRVVKNRRKPETLTSGDITKEHSIICDVVKVYAYLYDKAPLINENNLKIASQGSNSKLPAAKIKHDFKYLCGVYSIKGRTEKKLVLRVKGDFYFFEKLNNSDPYSRDDSFECTIVRTASSVKLSFQGDNHEGISIEIADLTSTKPSFKGTVSLSSGGTLSNPDFTVLDIAKDLSDIENTLTSKSDLVAETTAPTNTTESASNKNHLQGNYIFLSYFEQEKKGRIGRYPVELLPDGKAILYAISGDYYGEYTSLADGILIHFTYKINKLSKTKQNVTEIFLLNYEETRDVNSEVKILWGCSLGIYEGGGNQVECRRICLVKNENNFTDDEKKGKKSMRYSILEAKEVTDEKYLTIALNNFKGKTDNYIASLEKLYTDKEQIPLDDLPGKAYFYAALYLIKNRKSSEYNRIIPSLIEQAFFHGYATSNHEEVQYLIKNISKFGEFAPDLKGYWKIAEQQKTDDQDNEEFCVPINSPTALQTQLTKAREHILLINNYIPTLTDHINSLLTPIKNGKIKTIEIFLLDYRKNSDGRFFSKNRDIFLGDSSVEEIKKCVTSINNFAREILNSKNNSSSEYKVLTTFKLHFYNYLPAVAYSQYNPNEANVSFYFYHSKAYASTQLKVDLTNTSHSFKKDIDAHIKKLREQIATDNINKQVIFNLLEENDIKSIANDLHGDSSQGLETKETKLPHIQNIRTNHELVGKHIQSNNLTIEKIQIIANTSSRILDFYRNTNLKLKTCEILFFKYSNPSIDTERMHNLNVDDNIKLWKSLVDTFIFEKLVISCYNTLPTDHQSLFDDQFLITGLNYLDPIAPDLIGTMDETFFYNKDIGGHSEIITIYKNRFKQFWEKFSESREEYPLPLPKH